MTDEQPAQQAPQLGQRLKTAREAKGLSVEEVAERLNLRVVNIEDIEAERFDTDVSTTFTRGYVKQYAKLVDIPEDEAVTALDDLNAVKPEPTKLYSFSRKVSKQASDDRLMLISYIILAVIIGLVVLWWWQQSSDDKRVGATLPDTLLESGSETSNRQSLNSGANQAGSTQSNESETTGETTQAKPEPVDLSRVEPTVNEESTDTTETMPKQNAPAEAGSVEGAADQEANTRNSVATDSPGETASAAVADSADLDTTDNDVTPSTDAASQQAAAEQPKTESLASTQADRVEAEFEFAGDCWVNIVDATGEAIAYGIKKEGRTMPVSGVPPFEVTLGAPETVQVRFDGEPVDISDFRSGRTARFSLPRQ